ncbi:hypothetical protein [Amaricoccus sp. W119]|uniref:hypothetical protein n=1 Tax=Amaricoccus sp. W119 TaxID=3391833 RepID=UPI0039A529A9
MRNFAIRNGLYLSIALSLSGCLNTPDGQPNDIVNAGLAGAGIGALIGAVTGDDGGERTRNAAIGGVVGGAIGAGVGSVAAKRRVAYNAESASLDTEIRNASNDLAASKNVARSARSALESENQRLAALKRRSEQGQNIAADTERSKQRLKRQIASLDAEKASLAEEISHYEAVLSSARAEPGEDPASVQQKVAQLEARKRQLQEQYQDLNNIQRNTRTAVNSAGSLGEV